MEHVQRAPVLLARLLTMLEKLPPAADPVSRPLPQVTSSSDFVYCESQKYTQCRQAVLCAFMANRYLLSSEQHCTATQH